MFYSTVFRFGGIQKLNIWLANEFMWSDAVLQNAISDTNVDIILNIYE